MRKLLIILICIFSVISMSSCEYSNERPEEFVSMFESFDKSQDCIILTNKQLIVKDKYYDLSEIKHNDKICNIVFLEDDGFYSYTYDADALSVDFLFTTYENLETASLGTAVLPSDIINSFFGNDRFWFRMDDPDTDEFKQMYYSWCVDTTQTEIVDGDDISSEYEYATDNNRSENYSFSYVCEPFENYLNVTDNQTGVTKRIDSSILDTFDEGAKIKKANTMTSFNASQAFEKDGDIYFISYFEVGFLGDPCYYYVVKWNFETEECDYYTSFYFEEFPDRIDDMYIV